MCPPFPQRMPKGSNATSAALLRPGRLERLPQNRERLLDLGRAHGQRGRDPEGVAFESALADQEATLLRLLENPIGQRLVGSPIAPRLVLDELDSLHEPHPADVAHGL